MLNEGIGGTELLRQPVDTLGTLALEGVATEARKVRLAPLADADIPTFVSLGRRISEESESGPSFYEPANEASSGR